MYKKTKTNKNSSKKSKTNNKTKKNNVKTCMDTFVANKIKYWTNENTSKEQINQLKNMYKLTNCNIDCKNTILEPGSPNQIPKSMYKTLKNNKELIKMYNKQRKDIFKNKSNVLIDNFYENTPNKIKKQLIKEGAISQCVPT
jgi:hypothetical protein